MSEGAGIVAPALEQRTRMVWSGGAGRGAKRGGAEFFSDNLPIKLILGAIITLA